jgi:hypothetical protein
MVREEPRLHRRGYVAAGVNRWQFHVRPIMRTLVSYQTAINNKKNIRRKERKDRIE